MKTKFDLDTVQSEPVYHGGAFVLAVAVPLTQCAIVGFAVGLAVLAVTAGAMRRWAWWPLALCAGVLAFTALAVWRFVWEIRRPAVAALEELSGRDLDGDGFVGARVPLDNVRLDRLARHLLRLAADGKSISRRAVVPRMMTRGEWEVIMKRFVARGVIDRDRMGAAVLKCGTFEECWSRYVGEAQNARSFWVGEDGDLIARE
jgi:hypothetical protein